MDKEKFFIKTIDKLSSKLKVHAPIIKSDKRIKHYIASVTMCRCKIDGVEHHCPILKYNPVKMKTLQKWQIIYTALHELGHIKCEKASQEDTEYKAERFAHRAIRKYFPQYLERVIAYTEWVTQFGSKIYRDAYSRVIEDYYGRKI